MSIHVAPLGPRPERRRRNRVIRIRVDDTELATMRRAAQSLGVSLGSYVRNAAMKRTTKPLTTRTQGAIISQVAAMAERLKRLGNRLNDAEDRNQIKSIVGALSSISDSITRGGL